MRRWHIHRVRFFSILSALASTGLFVFGPVVGEVAGQSTPGWEIGTQAGMTIVDARGATTEWSFPGAGVLTVPTVTFTHVGAGRLALDGEIGFRGVEDEVLALVSGTIGGLFFLRPNDEDAPYLGVHVGVYHFVNEWDPGFGGVFGYRIILHPRAILRIQGEARYWSFEPESATELVFGVGLAVRFGGSDG